MTNSAKELTWKILCKRKVVLDKTKAEDVVDILLENRGIIAKSEKEFFLNPSKPDELKLKDFGIDAKETKRVVSRIMKAVRDKEKIVVFGDYDADGICATAIMWEVLHFLKADATPFIPDRFVDGYGISEKTVDVLKERYPNLTLIITVDNGIVAKEAVNNAGKLGIDVIITDHHEKERSLPKAFGIIHTKLISGSGIAWVVARELSDKYNKGLELSAIGTIADQLPVIGVNRSIIKYGLEALRKTKRVGLLSLFKDAEVAKEDVSPYIVGFVIAPRINAMGRLASALDSLRLLCTGNIRQAGELAKLVSGTNRERQKITEDVVVHARAVANSDGFIVVADANYHEGVIGLAAGKLVEEHFRPAIVISRGEIDSKASARSIPGVNLIKALRELEDMLVAVGGHEMAAGFSIKTKDIDLFVKRLSEISKNYLTPALMQKTLKIDMPLPFSAITYKLNHSLTGLMPYGQGNPTPTFVTSGVTVASSRLVGKDGAHLKLKLKSGDKYIDAIGFGLGEIIKDEIKGKVIDVVYSVEENVWNGNVSLQLKLRDLYY